MSELKPACRQASSDPLKRADCLAVLTRDFIAENSWLIHGSGRVLAMTLDEARESIIDGMNYAAYHETDFSLYDADKNRLFGSDHYNSGRFIAKPSPWAEGDFEEKMAMLLRWAIVLNRSAPKFAEAQKLLEGDDSVIGRVIQRAKHRR
jgi:hypothetical protein